MTTQRVWKENPKKHARKKMGSNIFLAYIIRRKPVEMCPD